MDDGTPIVLMVTIDPDQGNAVFDCTGTGPQSEGNCNTPRAVVQSAVLYCLRCMVGYDVPLNQVGMVVGWVWLWAVSGLCYDVCTGVSRSSECSDT